MAKIDLNLMTVLEAIYDEGSTTRAGEALHLSQSAVSHALGRLREIYGDPLFVRSGHQMLPTPTVKRIMPGIKTGLAAIRSSIVDVDKFDPSQHQQTFRIAQRDALETIISPPLVTLMEQFSPQCNLVSTHSSTDAIEDLLTSGEADVVVELAHPVSEQIQFMPLFTETLVVVGRKGHPYFRGKNTEQRLLEYPQALTTNQLSGREWIDRALASHGAKRQVTLRCRSYHSTIRVLLDSDKLSIIPRIYATSEATTLPLQITDIPFEVAPLELNMYWHANQGRDPACRWFRQLIAKALTRIETLSLSQEAKTLLNVN